MLFCVSARSSASQKLFLREDRAKRACFSSDTQEPPYGRGPPTSWQSQEVKLQMRVTDAFGCHTRDRLIRLDPRRSAIGGFTIPRPVAPALDPAPRATRRLPVLLRQARRFDPPARTIAAPLSSIPIAASGRIQAPSPCDGDNKSMQRDSTRMRARCEKVLGR